MLHSTDDANRLIAQGRWLHIAGDGAALARLARGNWVGGTIPYFLTATGGCVDQSRVFVTALPEELCDVGIAFVAPDCLAEISARAPEHGFSLVVIPAGSDAHSRYAIEAPDLPGIFEAPVIGWVAGVHLDQLGQVRPRVFDGRTGEASDDCIVVLRAGLPEAVMPEIGIINLFRQGDGDRFRFAETSFRADRCWINEAQASLFEYAKARAMDPRLPLVADMSGEMINVSFQAVDDVSRMVQFYAPVQAGVEYRQAAAVSDYHGEFHRHLAEHPVTPAFACNCILNYLYADLAGDRPISITGPATFGEIGYVLLNQTLVYLELRR
jgi:hypothetical protein